MGYGANLIAPFATGMDTDKEPWQSPPDSFQDIENAHIHHGYIEKRSGIKVFGKLVHGNAVDFVISAITQADPGVVTVVSTTDLTDGDKIVIYDVVGMTEVNNVEYLVANKTATTFELTDLQGVDIDTTGFTAYVSGGTVNIIPGLRAMGLYRYIDSTNAKELVGFDTERACRYDATAQVFKPVDSANIFDSEDTDYIWADNWASTSSSTAATLFRLYFTNGRVFDGTLNGIRYYDGAATTTSYAPLINSVTRINGCQLLFSFKQRLLLLNTFEGANTYPQRARWCQIQNPDDSQAWDDNIAGRGGFVDAPTGDQIISARPLQDSIIVFFTNSVWNLRPVSDPALPFRWEKINDYKACDGKMATVGYDRYVVALGQRGITATNGVETTRIDERIEDFVTEEVDVDNFNRVYAARSYANRRTWVLYNSSDTDADDPDADAALIHDEESSAYSKYIIDMNVLGYGSTSENTTYEELDVEYQDDEIQDKTYRSFFLEGNSEVFIGGDKNGIIYELETGTSDNGLDIDVKLDTAAWAPFKEEGRESQFGYIDFFVDANQTTNFIVEFFKDNSEAPYKTQQVDCLPNLNYRSSIAAIVLTDGGDPTLGVTVTSNTHGLKTGDEIYIYGVVGMSQINNTQSAVTVIDGDVFTIDVNATGFGSYVSGGQIVERAFYRTKVWKRAYSGGYGYQHRIRITSLSGAKFLRIHAFKPYFRARGRRTIN